MARRSLDRGCVNNAPLPESRDVGLNVHGFASLDPADDAFRQQYLQILRNSNVGWARVDVEWRSIQPDNGTTWNWGDLDVTMARAYCAGVNVLGTLNFTPYWASSNKGAIEPTHYNAADSTDWINFVSTTVSRYPWVRYWTIWNEPNDPNQYGGSVSDYVSLVRWASAAIRLNPDGRQRFLVAGEFGWSGNTTAWVDTLLAAQGANVDILSVHMYGQPYDSFINQIVNRPSVSSLGKEVWLTEAGVSGCHDNVGLQSSPTCVNVSGTTSGATADRDYIDDQVQSNDVDSTVAFMRRAGSRWTKTFFFDAAAEVTSQNGTEDYGFFGGSSAHALYAKRASYALARANGVSPQISISGPSSVRGGSLGTFTATVSGGHQGPYYYEWELECNSKSDPAKCKNAEGIIASGWNLTSIAFKLPAVDGSASVSVVIRDTELDSPVTTAFAARSFKTVFLSAR